MSSVTNERGELEELRDENAALKADAVRWQYMLKHSLYCDEEDFYSRINTKKLLSAAHRQWYWRSYDFTAVTADEAVDAAIRAISDSP